MKILLATLQSIFIIMCHAQVVIPVENFDIGSGFSSSGIRVEWEDPSPAGPDQFWDFSDWTSIGPFGIYAFHPDSTPFGEHFPLATYSLGDGDINYFYQADEAGLIYQCEASTSGDLSNCVDPMLIHDIPVLYGGSGTDEFQHYFVWNDDSLVYQGNSTFEVDAWGAMSLPYGTVNDAIRVHSFIERSTTRYNSLGEITFENDRVISEYLYYAIGTPFPIVRFRDITQNGLQSLLHIELLNEDQVALHTREINSTNTFDIRPNPSQGAIELILYGDHSDMVEILVHDQRAHLVHRYAVPAGWRSIPLDLECLAAGLYSLTLVGEGVHSTRKLVIE